MTNPVKADVAAVAQTATSKWRALLKWLNPTNVYTYLANLEANARTYTKWHINPVGIAYHMVIGLIIGHAYRATGGSEWCAEVTSAWGGATHELADGDLLTSPGHPVNGLLDIAWFMLGTALAYL